MVHPAPQSVRDRKRQLAVEVQIEKREIKVVCPIDDIEGTAEGGDGAYNMGTGVAKRLPISSAMKYSSSTTRILMPAKSSVAVIIDLPFKVGADGSAALCSTRGIDYPAKDRRPLNRLHHDQSRSAALPVE
jgi:hypothetical protein